MPSHEQRSVVFRGRRFALPSWRTLGIVAGAVVVVALLGTVAWFWNASQQQRGGMVFADALARHRPLENPMAPAESREAGARDLERILGEYPSNLLAPQAAYMLGNIRFSSAQYDRARAAYQIAVNRAGSATIATLARAGIGYSWEAEKKLPEAAGAFEAALSSLKPGAFYYEELLADLARVQERSGKKDAAIATYRRLLKDAPKSPRAGEFKTRLASLGATP